MESKNNKNGFLITWGSCIVFLLVLCFFGISDTMRGTFSAVVPNDPDLGGGGGEGGGGKMCVKYDCPNGGDLVGSRCVISEKITVKKCDPPTTTSCTTGTVPSGCTYSGGNTCVCPGECRYEEESKDEMYNATCVSYEDLPNGSTGNNNNNNNNNNNKEYCGAYPGEGYTCTKYTDSKGKLCYKDCVQSKNCPDGYKLNESTNTCVVDRCPDGTEKQAGTLGWICTGNSSPTAMTCDQAYGNPGEGYKWNGSCSVSATVFSGFSHTCNCSKVCTHYDLDGKCVANSSEEPDDPTEDDSRSCSVKEQVGCDCDEWYKDGDLCYDCDCSNRVMHEDGSFTVTITNADGSKTKEVHAKINDKYVLISKKTVLEGGTIIFEVIDDCDNCSALGDLDVGDGNPIIYYTDEVSCEKKSNVDCVKLNNLYVSPEDAKNGVIFEDKNVCEQVLGVGNCKSFGDLGYVWQDCDCEGGKCSTPPKDYVPGGGSGGSDGQKPNTPGTGDGGDDDSNTPGNSKPNNDGNVTTNPQTGEIAIFMILILGFSAVGYSIWYYIKSKKES